VTETPDVCWSGVQYVDLRERIRRSKSDDISVRRLHVHRDEVGGHSNQLVLFASGQSLLEKKGLAVVGDDNAGAVSYMLTEMGSTKQNPFDHMQQLNLISHGICIYIYISYIYVSCIFVYHVYIYI
jgi:hypothetical protein